MNIKSNILSPAFGRKLTTSEEKEYAETLKNGRNKLSGGNSNTSLIMPSSSLPQLSSNNTGVGNIATEESQKFFDFAKKYWGINEVQLLPVGQYHSSYGEYPIYSGTSMDLGNHLIDVKSILPKEEFDKIVNNNNLKDRVNFSNVVDFSSVQEKAIKNLYESIPEELKKEFETYKTENSKLLESKGIFRALTEINNTADFNYWNDLDKNLFNEDIISVEQREKRIKEVYAQKSKTIDFYKFKQFLAEKSLKKAKADLNAKGIKLSGDVPCSMSFDEVWSHPKAFVKDATIGWDLPALNYESPEAEKLIREKFNIYAKRFDGLRVDAAWSYISPVVKNNKTGETTHKNYCDKILKIIEDEIKKVKGNDFDLKNIKYEFAAGPEVFNIFDGNTLKPYVKDRVKIYTSDYISNDWGSVDNFVNTRGWSKDSFMLGMTNHDSDIIKPSETQIETLSSILKIPKEKLQTSSEFLKAKFAEPMSAKNMMLFFMNTLGMEGRYKDNPDKTLNYTAKVPENYEDFYHNALKNGKGFNPMDALEKQFVAQGLNKTEPKLYRKIVKYRDILEDKTSETQKIPYLKYCTIALGIGALLYGIYRLSYQHRQKQNT